MPPRLSPRGRTVGSMRTSTLLFTTWGMKTELPKDRRSPQVYVQVRWSDYSDWGLSFVGFLERGASTIGGGVFSPIGTPWDLARGICRALGLAARRAIGGKSDGRDKGSWRGLPDQGEYRSRRIAELPCSRRAVRPPDAD